MPADFDDLAAADCPLVARPGLIAAYNRRAAAFRLLAAKAPALLADPAVGALAGRLAAVRARLTRVRYQIGFLGPFQIGKSSTFNNLAGVPKADSPSPEGGTGEATSSTVSRLFAVPGGRHTFALTYLTAAEYRAKLDILCQPEFVGRADAELDAAVAKAIEAARVGGGPATGSLAKFELLRALRASFAAHGRTLVRETPVVRTDIPYAQRETHLMHDRDAPASPNLLLKQAELGLANTVLPPQLEMIDLPGLGSKGVLDTVLTKEFMDELDGVLVFAAATKIGNADTEEAIGDLARRFPGRLAKRMWLVVTQFDGLNRNAYQGDLRGDSTFSTIDRLLTRFQLPADRVHLVSNPIYAEAQGEPAGIDEKVLRGKLEEKKGDLGPDLVPAAFRKFPKLLPAYEHLIKDGGIPRLRALLVADLGGLVAAEIEEWATAELDPVGRELVACVERAERLQGLDTDGLEKVAECRTRLANVRTTLTGRPTALADLGAAVHAELFQRFERICPADDTLENLTPAELATQFRATAKVLDANLQRLTHDAAGKAVAWVRGLLANLPDVPVGDAGTSVAAAFAAAEADALLADPHFPTFAADYLFDAAAAADPDVVNLLTGGTYRGLMHEKMWRAVHQLTHAVRARLAARVRALSDELDRMTAGAGAATAAAPLAAVRAELGGLA